MCSQYETEEIARGHGVGWLTSVERGAVCKGGCYALPDKQDPFEMVLGFFFHLRDLMHKHGVFNGMKSIQHENVYSCGILEKLCLDGVHTEPVNFRK